MAKLRSMERFRGVLIYESESRRDKCYYIKYKNQTGKQIIEKIGWASEGITPQQAQLIRNERIKAIRLGDEVITIQQKRKMAIVLRHPHNLVSPPSYPIPLHSSTPSPNLVTNI